MTGIIVDIMVEILIVLAIMTKEVKCGRLSESILHRCTILDFDRHVGAEKYFRKLVGNTDINDSLQRLDKLTQEEAWMAFAELLKVTHSVDAKVTGVDDRVRDVGEQVDDVRGDVQVIGDKVQDIDHRVQGIGSDVNDISCEVREVNRSLSCSTLLVVLRAQTMTQGICSEIVFFDGFRRQIHPSTITLHPKLITMAQRNGFFKEKHLINGNPLVHSCGYTESVCHS